MADGARVNKGVKCEKPPLQGPAVLCWQRNVSAFEYAI